MIRGEQQDAQDALIDFVDVGLLVFCLFVIPLSIALLIVVWRVAVAASGLTS